MKEDQALLGDNANTPADRGQANPDHDDWTFLVCPNCDVHLGRDGDTLRCLGCPYMCPIIDGVPHLVEDFPYWGEIPVEQMRKVNQLAGMGSWKAALLESSDPLVQRAAEMIMNIDRANWHLLAELPRHARVLDIGAGTGTNSHALATHYGEVIALEPVLERIQFMKQRFAQEKLANVRVIRGSTWALPFPAHSFDLIVMNGVLEWVAEGREGDPGELQACALKNVFRLLRPGGYLYLGIENRICLGYFIGYPDPHCGLPFVTVLPRRLAHWYARRKGHREGYRNYLHSSFGYHKLLRSVGFKQVDCYLALPSYNHPRFLIPLKGDTFSYYSRTFTPKPAGRLRQIARDFLLRAGLLKYFESSFSILARVA